MGASIGRRSLDGTSVILDLTIIGTLQLLTGVRVSANGMNEMIQDASPIDGIDRESRVLHRERKMDDPTSEDLRSRATAMCIDETPGDWKQGTIGYDYGGRLTIRPATAEDRDTIYGMRHDVFARELGQHPKNGAGRLIDARDAFNSYVVACDSAAIVGFVSVTPPGGESYSVDTTLRRSELPFAVDKGLYKVRLLTVRVGYRRGIVAPLLMLAAFRYVEARGGTRIMVVGRCDLRGMYAKIGLRSHGIAVQSGAVTFELMSGRIAELREAIERYDRVLRRLSIRVDWQLGEPFQQADDQATFGHSR
jgi:hypothetical protein